MIFMGRNYALRQSSLESDYIQKAEVCLLA